MAITSRHSLWLVLALASAAAPSYAWPTTSPSAKSAARLKYHPPDNWLQHYLPDDRYKIAGGVWKVVSTQYDTYYHRPDSQYMLRQPAGIVIGFASAEEAEEAGYRPDGAYFAGSYGSVGGSSKIRLGKGRRSVVVSGKRVRLSDGSSALLPDGWTLRRGGSQTIGNAKLSFDLMMPSTADKQKAVGFIFVDQPGQNAEMFADTKYLRKLMADAKSTGSSLSSATGIVTNEFDGASALSDSKNIAIGATRLGGMKATSITNKVGASSSMIMAGRGSRMYLVFGAKGSAGTAPMRAIVQSFRPG